MRRAAVALGALLVGASAPGVLAGTPARAGSLAWERTFGPAAVKPDLALRAKVEDAAGTSHSLELWRQGDKRLRRRGDEVLEIGVEDVGAPASPAYAFTLVDLRGRTVRRLTPERARSLGPTYTWWPLAHLLGLPAPRYTLQRLTDPGLRVGPARCEWFLYAPEALPEQRICWSREFAVALRVDEKQGTRWSPRLTVESLRAILPTDPGLRLDTTGLREMAIPEPDDD